jgi:tetratricopeptide (TPR) repeat protein
MRRLAIPMLFMAALLVDCAARTDRSTQGTLAELRAVSPDLEEAEVEHGLQQAMAGYRQFLEETPQTEMTPEAMRRLADLQIEKQFGIRGGDTKPREIAAPEPAQPLKTVQVASTEPGVGFADLPLWESDQDFERRTTAESRTLGGSGAGGLPAGSGAGDLEPQGPLEAIAIYQRLLAEYPDYEQRDKVLYQMARAYDELGRTEEAVETMDRLMAANQYSEHYDEVQFRRGEYYFTRRNFRDAEDAYSAIINLGTDSSYHELALYKLGWTLYKQEFYEEALHRYIALLDYKVSIGYDFDQTHAEDDERLVADTYRVISLSFTNSGSPEDVQEYFSTFGQRSYEDRVYSNLGEHYLAKLRYDDAAKTYRSFVALYPHHEAAPRFSMHVVDTFTQGGFPKLVLEAKRDFASNYGLQSDYWRHFKTEESPEVVAYLKSNLKDLATHYHAKYQSTEEQDEKNSHYAEALHWYGDYLQSFPTEGDSPPINYQLADLLLENEDFGEAARQYEHTAYNYPQHPQSAAAGYAAVYAYREQLKIADDEMEDIVKHNTVASSLRFTDAFPDHEHAASILGAAADDMYEMKSYPAAVASAHRVIENYPDAAVAIRRSAWIVVAHGSLELSDYPLAEGAYTQVLASTPEDDESHGGFVENLAATIYKQGELANEAEDFRTAADHFLRIRTAAPTSTIRATAEYDAGVALLALQEWPEAARVMNQFRNTYPEHELQLEATRSIAYAYREDGQLSRAADEYQRIASQAEDPAMRSEALLVAGDLYQQSQTQERALEVYRQYVDEFPDPVEPALETRLKIAEIHKAAQDEVLYEKELAAIVCLERDAGPERTARTRTIAARSAQVLAEKVYEQFVAVRLLQPFEASLQEKQQRMDLAIKAMEQLVTYEIADATSAATYYMAETYLDFSHALTESERPANLQPQELAEYDLVLEEEAFPFEERAIALHEENLEMMHAGVFNPWTEKSLGQLTGLMPGRYAKNELSSGFVGSIGVYVYRTPAADIYGPELDNDGTVAQNEPVQTANLTPVEEED